MDKHFIRINRIKSFLPVQVIADIDDTIHAYGNAHFNVHISGFDERLPNKTLYPCVKSIFRLIFNNYGKMPIVLVSARPFFLEHKKKELERILNLPLSIYGGDFLSSFGAVTANYMKIAHKKIENINMHIQENGLNVRYIWFGDNGQGDEIVAIKLLEERKIEAAFIHKVLNKSKYEMSNLYYFCSYSDVASILKQILKINVNCNVDDSFTYSEDCVI